MSTEEPVTLEIIFRDMQRTFAAQANELQRSVREVPEYLDLSFKMLDQETAIFAKYLATRPVEEREPAFQEMLLIWQREMVDRNIKYIEKGFFKLLEDDCVLCLRKCFRTLSNAQMGLENVPRMFGDFIYRQARLATSQLSGIDQIDFYHFVSKLVALKIYFSNILVKCFFSHDKMHEAMEKSFHNVLFNENEPGLSRGPKLLAMYWDSWMKKERAAVESGKAISDSMHLCTMSSDVQYYAEENLKFLFYRLVNGSCYYYSLEVMLLKELIGIMSSGNKDLMDRGVRAMEDMVLKFGLNNAYQKYKDINEEQSKNLVPTKFLTLQENLWSPVPCAENESECALPDFCRSSIAHFEQFYSKYCEKRKLKWMHHWSTAEVEIRLSGAPCTVRITLYGTAILYCFQVKDELSLKCIQEKTKLKPSVLLQETNMLIDIGLLNKKSTKKLTMNEVLALNLKFSEGRKRSGIFFPEKNNVGKETKATTRLKLLAARRAERLAGSKELRKKRHLELHHPSLDLDDLSVLAISPPEPHSQRTPTALTLEHKLTHSDCNSANVRTQAHPKSKPLPAVKTLSNPQVKPFAMHSVLEYFDDACRKARVMTEPLPCEEAQKCFTEALCRMETIIEETFQILERMPRQSVTLPTVTPECLTSVMATNTDNNDVSEHTQKSGAVGKECSAVIFGNPKPPEERKSPKSQGAIPKERKQAYDTGDALTTEKSRKVKKRERSMLCKEQDSEFLERYADGNESTERSTGSLFALKVKSVHSDVKLEEELQIFKKELAKQVVIAETSFSKFSECDLLASDDDGFSSTETPGLDDIIPTIQISTFNDVSDSKLGFSNIPILTECEATRLEDLPGYCIPRPKRNRKARMRQEQIEQTEAESEASNIISPESFTPIYSKTWRSHKCTCSHSSQPPYARKPTTSEPRKHKRPTNEISFASKKPARVIQATVKIKIPVEINPARKITAPKKTVVENVLATKEPPTEDLSHSSSAGPQVPTASPKTAPRSIYTTAPQMTPPPKTTVVQGATPTPAPRRQRSIKIDRERTPDVPNREYLGKNGSSTTPNEQNALAMATHWCIGVGHGDGDGGSGSALLENPATRKSCLFKKCAPLAKHSASEEGSASAKDLLSSTSDIFTKESTLIKSSTPANTAASEKPSTSSHSSSLAASSVSEKNTTKKTTCTTLLARPSILSGTTFLNSSATAMRLTAATTDLAADEGCTSGTGFQCPLCAEAYCHTFQHGHLQHPRVRAIKKRKI